MSALTDLVVDSKMTEEGAKAVLELSEKISSVIAEGCRLDKLGVASEDELAALIVAFNTMSGQLGGLAAKLVKMGVPEEVVVDSFLKNYEAEMAAHAPSNVVPFKKTKLEVVN